jgi:hypothetical protein
MFGEYWFHAHVPSAYVSFRQRSCPHCGQIFAFMSTGCSQPEQMIWSGPNAGGELGAAMCAPEGDEMGRAVSSRAWPCHSMATSSLPSHATNIMRMIAMIASHLIGGRR